MASKAITPAMYFTSLEIENVKCFGSKQTLDLTDGNGHVSRWTLILGDNGVGKTTLLKSLAWMIPVEETDEKVKNDAKIDTVAIKPSMDDIQDESIYEQLAKNGGNVTCRIASSFSMGVGLGESIKNRKSVSHGIGFTIQNGKLEGEIALEFGALKQFNTVNLFAYSASRHMASRNFDRSDLKDPITNLFSDSGDLYDAEQALTNLEYASLKENGRGKSTSLLAKVKRILVDLLPDILDVNSIIINSPINIDGTKNDNLVEVITPYGRVPLSGLSLGYQTMFAWSVDLALRMLWLNPESDDPLNEPAIVIVDEIDLHLHPKWQRNIRNYLTQHFSRTQFICTAHSPFMAQASELENLCVLNQIEDEVHIENNPSLVQGWRIGQVITSDLFGIPSERSPNIEGMVEERRKILDKKRKTQIDKMRLNHLDELLAYLPTSEISSEDNQLLDQIRKAAKLIKMNELK